MDVSQIRLNFITISSQLSLVSPHFLSSNPIPSVNHAPAHRRHSIHSHTGTHGPLVNSPFVNHRDVSQNRLNFRTLSSQQSLVAAPHSVQRSIQHTSDRRQGCGAGAITITTAIDHGGNF